MNRFLNAFLRLLLVPPRRHFFLIVPLATAVLTACTGPRFEQPAVITATPTSRAASVLAKAEPPPQIAATFTPIPTITPRPTATNLPVPTPIPSPTLLPPTAVPAVAPLPALPARLPAPTGNISRTESVPILMYHYVSTPPEDADNYRVNLSVEPEAFYAQMQYLAENGYTVVDLYTVMEAFVNETDLPPKPIVLTFDDGYIDNYEYAYPILEAFGFKGTFFIVTEFVDFEYEAYMNWAMIEEMAAAGHRMEPHTKSHPDLATMGRNDLVWQILGAQETLAAHIGYKPQFLSYPGGRYDEQTLEMVDELSLWGAVTTRGGMWRGFYDRYEWPRTRISYTTTVSDLHDALNRPRPTPTPDVSPTPTPTSTAAP